ncbi:MAG: 4-hydroxybenzoate octaprenyltransferase [Paracoccaceae bacterium]|nr:4-hydroxybenzoate octaprenyltransferase [Paracoccaceae bacterium]
MTEQSRTEEAMGKVSDATKGNWVDAIASEFSRPYLRLSRADRPIGTWLLLIPCWWGLVLAILQDRQASLADLWIFVGCAFGAFLMRGAGCTWNDITDRNYDGAVERTKSRPIPSGHVSVLQAVVWMGLQTLLSSFILFSFNWVAIMLGFISLIPVVVYPFAKRFTWWPQVFLGIAFNWGALLAFAAHSGSVHGSAILLYLSGIAWTLFYDTIYAHQDKEDDALIGIKSTARLFGDATNTWLWGFSLLSSALMLGALWFGTSGLSFIISSLGVVGFWVHKVWQIRCVNLADTENLLRIFRSNRNAGLVPLIFFACAVML